MGSEVPPPLGDYQDPKPWVRKVYREHLTRTTIKGVNVKDKTKTSAFSILTLSAMAPWDLIDSWGGGVKVPGLLKTLKTSLNHHLTMKFCIYPQDVFRTRL